ncbi:hypothetical protein K8R66_01025, partial [bacterium]|nr:hypothetical protein [bacterium]
MESNSGKLKPKYILSIDDIPDISLQYSQIILNLEIQQKIYEYLYPQYEAAKIDELKDLPTIEVIDKAVPAGKRSKPKRARFCVVAFILGIFISSLIVIIKFLLEEEQIKKIKQIMKLLTSFNK